MFWAPKVPTWPTHFCLPPTPRPRGTGRPTGLCPRHTPLGDFVQLYSSSSSTKPPQLSSKGLVKSHNASRGLCSLLPLRQHLLCPCSPPNVTQTVFPITHPPYSSCPYPCSRPPLCLRWPPMPSRPPTSHQEGLWGSCVPPALASKGAFLFLLIPEGSAWPLRGSALFHSPAALLLPRCWGSSPTGVLCPPRKIRGRG